MVTPVLRVSALAGLCRAGDVFTPESPSARGNLVISRVGKIFKESQCQTQPWESCSAAAPRRVGCVCPARRKPGSIRPRRGVGLVKIGSFGCPAPRQLLGIAGAVQPPSPAAASALPWAPRCAGTRSSGTGLLLRCPGEHGGDGRFQRWERTRQRSRVSHGPVAPICCPPGPG